MSTTKRMFFATLAAIALALVSYDAATAQLYCTCDIVDGCKIITYYDAAGNVTGTDTICPSSGSGNFDCQEPPPPTGPIDLSLPPVSIDANGNSAQFGPIVTTLDPNRTSSNATIRSLFPPARFPAEARISFYARTTVNGVEYCSRTELVFSSRNVNSYPFQNEQFCLESDVEFYRCDDPAQVTAFVLHANTSPRNTCVTLNGR